MKQRTTLAYALALALVSPIAPSHAQSPPPPIEPCEDLLTIGGACAGPFVLTCPSSHVLAGLIGRSGQLLDQLTPLCVEIDIEDRWIGEPTPLRTVGGAGGSPIEAVCPRNMAISGYSGDANEHVIKLKLQCMPIESNSNAPLLLRFGEAPTDGESAAGQICGESRRAVGVRGAAQQFINRFGLLCVAILGRPIFAPPPVADQPLNSVRPKVFVPH